MPMSTNINLSKWSDSQLAEDSDDDASLGVAKLVEHKQRQQEAKAREQRRREEEEAAKHTAEEQERRERKAREAARRVSSMFAQLQ